MIKSSWKIKVLIIQGLNILTDLYPVLETTMKGTKSEWGIRSPPIAIPIHIEGGLKCTKIL